jgi:hypothetical protein
MSSFEHEKVIKDTPRVSWCLVTASLVTYVITYSRPDLIRSFMPTTSTGFMFGLFYPGYKVSYLLLNMAGVHMVSYYTVKALKFKHLVPTVVWSVVLLALYIKFVD